MKRFAYLWVLLLMSAQVDEAWAVAPDFSSAVLADDNDEFLPAQRRPQEELTSSRQKPVLSIGTPRTADFSFVSRGVPSEWNSTTPFSPPPLYVFMSLQI